MPLGCLARAHSGWLAIDFSPKSLTENQAFGGHFSLVVFVVVVVLRLLLLLRPLSLVRETSDVFERAEAGGESSEAEEEKTR